MGKNAVMRAVMAATVVVVLVCQIVADALRLLQARLRPLSRSVLKWSPAAGEPQTVAVIGGGPGGIASALELLDAGFEVTLFEQRSVLGGLWGCTEVSRVGYDAPVEELPFVAAEQEVRCCRGAYSAAYRDLFTNTSRPMTSFSRFPYWPDTTAAFPRLQQVHAYLQRVIAESQLTDRARVRLSTSVVQASPLDATDPGTAWQVTWAPVLKNDPRSGLALGEQETAQFDCVVVASGQFSKPHVPAVRGLSQFKGTKLHSKAYRSAASLRGKRVLVIGGGSSACDIAAEAATEAQETHISVRNPDTLLLPIILDGKPVDFNFSLLGGYIPMALRKRGMAAALRRAFGGGTAARYGFPAPSMAERPFDALRFAPNGKLLPKLRDGSVVAHGDLDSFSGHSAQFSDGTAVDIDVVILATGFELHFPFLDSGALNMILEKDRVAPLVHQVIPPHLHTIGFIGLTHGGILFPLAELQARMLVSFWRHHHPLQFNGTPMQYTAVHGEAKAPLDADAARQLCQAEAAAPIPRTPLQRHKVHATPHADYAMQLATAIGAAPRLARLIRHHRSLSLAQTALFAPLLASVFRTVPAADGWGKTNTASQRKQSDRPLLQRVVGSPQDAAAVFAAMVQEVRTAAPLSMDNLPCDA